ncbi:MAG: transcription termination factor NusA [Planctomycetes bacterium]|nr:transcription termination factor NusA [Planctomycetota bacterium]
MHGARVERPLGGCPDGLTPAPGFLGRQGGPCVDRTRGPRRFPACLHIPSDRTSSQPGTHTEHTMNRETLAILDSIARERNIDRELLIHDLEQAMVSAARKHFNSLDTEEFGCEIDRLSGGITLWRELEDGSREPIDLKSLGRIPAQTAKQVMIQKFREDERNSLLEEFGKRQGELVTGTAARYEGGALIVQIDRIEGFMPRSEQIPGEQFQPGDRVRCLILDVRDSINQVKIVLSRAHPDFIRKLFEAEVPEVAERVIEIKAMSREPGFRTKLAVSSVDSKVDPVGACVGVRGSRIRNIVDELGGEKIDIVRWNESSQVLIANALKPAEVEEVSLCFELGRGTIIVREDQLSLAIGRRGQNVRLAARLTGWDIDILTPAEFDRNLQAIQETLTPIEGFTDEMLDKMGALGLISVFDIEEVGMPVLMQELGMAEDLAERVVVACGEKGKVIAEEQRIAAEAEAVRKAEEAAATDHLLGGGPAVETDAQSESAADSILGGG